MFVESSIMCQSRHFLDDALCSEATLLSSCHRMSGARVICVPQSKCTLGIIALYLVVSDADIPSSTYMTYRIWLLTVFLRMRLIARVFFETRHYILRTVTDTAQRCWNWTAFTENEMAGTWSALPVRSWPVWALLKLPLSWNWNDELTCTLQEQY